jgi:flagellar assembly protein FliH
MSEIETPKEQLTAYQRWELPSFDGTGTTDHPARVAASGLPTAAQLEQMHQQAHEEGYRAGHAEGMRQAAQESLRIGEVMTSLDVQLKQVDQQVVQVLLDLALEVARQMVRQALQVKPELLLKVVHEAVSSLPHFNQTAHLILHPEDAALVRAGMGDQLNHSGWKIFEEPSMMRGGCRVETAHSQIDATLPKRWQQVVAHIAQDSAWLES